MSLKREIGFLFHIVRINLKSSLVLRGAFCARLLFVAFNNLIFFVSWVIFFKKFILVNGWNFHHVCFMYGLVNVALGVNTLFFNGLKLLPKLVEYGELDVLMTRPLSLLVSVASYKSDYSGLGSIISGIFLLSLSPITNAYELLLVLFFIFTSIAVFASITLLYGSLSFVFQDIGRLSMDLYNVMVMLSTIPNCIYKGILKIIIFTLIPVGFVSYLPVSFIIHKNPETLLFLLCGTLGLTVFSIFVFYKGLRRYESGSSSMVVG